MSSRRDFFGKVLGTAAASAGGITAGSTPDAVNHDAALGTLKEKLAQRISESIQNFHNVTDTFNVSPYATTIDQKLNQGIDLPTIFASDSTDVDRNLALLKALKLDHWSSIGNTDFLKERWTQQLGTVETNARKRLAATKQSCDEAVEEYRKHFPDTPTTITLEDGTHSTTSDLTRLIEEASASFDALHKQRAEEVQAFIGLRKRLFDLIAGASRNEDERNEVTPVLLKKIAQHLTDHGVDAEHLIALGDFPSISTTAIESLHAPLSRLGVQDMQESMKLWQSEQTSHTELLKQQKLATLRDVFKNDQSYTNGAEILIPLRSGISFAKLSQIRSAVDTLTAHWKNWRKTPNPPVTCHMFVDREHTKIAPIDTPTTGFGYALKVSSAFADTLLNPRIEPNIFQNADALTEYADALRLIQDCCASEQRKSSAQTR